MSSQVDIFGNDDLPKYDAIVLFEKSSKLEKPFGLYPTSMFAETEIQGKWLNCVLDDSSRMKTLPLESIPDHQFCLFGKFDSGK